MLGLMAQVTKMECDVCGASSVMNRAGDWWSVTVARRDATQVQFSQQIPGLPTGFPPGPVEPTEPPFGALRLADVCSSKCAQAFAKEATTEPKPSKKAAEAEVE